MNRKHSFTQGVWCLMGALLLALPLWSEAAMMMPNRDVLTGTQLVVWGNNLPGGAANYEIDFGDATSSGVIGTGANGQSYMPATHTYNTLAAQEDFIAELKLDGVLTGATVTITVINEVAAALTADQILDVKINQAIEDGLRSQYVNQANRETNFGGSFASWSGTTGNSFTMSFTSLAVLAFENHGHNLASGDIYSEVVQRGLNFIFDNLRRTALSNDPGDPCAEIYSGLTYGDPLAPGPSCTGLSDLGGIHGYSTAVSLLAIAASGAPAAIVAHGFDSGGFTVGQTYLEIVQRLVNTVAFAQKSGGWLYGFNQGNDGSANGWNVLSLLDGQAFGATVPAFVFPQLNIATAALSLGDGSMGYRGKNAQNTAKSGIRLQATSLTGIALLAAGPGGGPSPQTTINYINAGWKGRSESFLCSSAGIFLPFQTANFGNNFGCMYAMFNVFKGLKLYGILTLPNSSRADKDWHKEYQDYLTQKQQSPTTTTGGGWGNLFFSCCSSDTNGESALALLILSPAALILPDAVKFALLGLTPFTAENFVDEQHTVTAHAEGSCSPDPCVGSPVPGATVDFVVLTGPNAGQTGQDVTDASGDATFTYAYYNPAQTSGFTGTDTIQASIGNMDSNIVDKEWKLHNQPPVAVCIDVEVDANNVCEALANIDGGSYDPDEDDSIVVSQFPSGPFDLGATSVTLTVTDLLNESDSCSAIVTVVDVTEPVVQCNAPATITPPDVPISFTAIATDNCSVTVEVTGYDCTATNGAGKTIDKTESCVVTTDGATLNILDSGGVGDHITWTVVATDGSGNTASVDCAVDVLNPGKGNTGGGKGNNGIGNGDDPQPPGNPPVNDGADTLPNNHKGKGGKK